MNLATKIAERLPLALPTPVCHRFTPSEVLFKHLSVFFPSFSPYITCILVINSFDSVLSLSHIFNQSGSCSIKGVPKFRVISVLQKKRRLGGGSIKKMAGNFKKCDVGVKTKLGVVYPATEVYVGKAIDAIRAGKVIAVPTDTLYGFSCDACSLEAVNRIYEIKGRKSTSPLAVCVGDVSDIERFAMTGHLPHGLLGSLLPGPVTVVLRRGELIILEKTLNPGLDSIGIRVPDYNFIRAIARGSGSALALTSANLSGQPSSVSIKDFENLWEHCAYIFDGGVLPSGRAGSTVVDLTKLGKFKILRSGSAQEETVSILESHSLIEAAATT